ncbi:ketopantoate reductase PanE/ApbA C terminal-domain-containing protein [Auriculariales sp. MPI-PUGE-AT-0066]|nr:ketopantoate reductase PanE/ApbA C terminal-domain-containing protein [Auriculariales sp. MPI-PUGE-AT-0066]
MHIHVLGAAPFGHLLAFHLQRAAKTNVTLFLKQENAGVLNRPLDARLRVETPDGVGDETMFSWELWDPALRSLERVVFDRRGHTRLPSNRPLYPIRSLIVTTKPTSTVAAVRNLQTRLDASSTLVILQGGLAVYDSLIREVFSNPEQRPHFILGLSSHGIWRRTQHHLVHDRVGGFKFGIIAELARSVRRDFEASESDSLPFPERTLKLQDIYSGPKDDPRYLSLRQTVTALLQTEALKSRWLPMATMHRRLLRDCVVQSCVQPIAALSGCVPAALKFETPARRMIEEVCKEAAAVFHAQNVSHRVQVRKSNTSLNIKSLVAEVMRHCDSADSVPTQMGFHLDSGVLTDVDYYNGYLELLGKQFQVPTPSISMLLNMVKLKHSLVLRGKSDKPIGISQPKQGGSDY